MSEKIYCPDLVKEFIPLLQKFILSGIPIDKKTTSRLDDMTLCMGSECGKFSRQHGICAIVALADKPPLTVALDIPAEGTYVEGCDNK
jgi:hypothetical protein